MINNNIQPFQRIEYSRPEWNAPIRSWRNGREKWNFLHVMCLNTKYQIYTVTLSMRPNISFAITEKVIVFIVSIVSVYYGRT